MSLTYRPTLLEHIGSALAVAVLIVGTIAGPWAVFTLDRLHVKHPIWFSVLFLLSALMISWVCWAQTTPPPGDVRSAEHRGPLRTIAKWLGRIATLAVLLSASSCTAWFATDVITSQPADDEEWCAYSRHCD